MRVTIKPAIWNDAICDYMEVTPDEFIRTTEANASSACANYAIKYLRRNKIDSESFEFWVIDDVYGEMVDVIRYDYSIGTLD